MNEIVNGVANDYEFDMPMYYEPKSKTSKLDETQIFTRWIDPTIKEKDKKIEELQSKIDKAIEYVNTWLVDEYSICVPDKKEPDVFCHYEPNAKEKLLDILKENE